MKKDISLSILSALLLILSFPNFNLWIFAWFGFVPLFFAIENKSKFNAFLLSCLTGIIFWTGIIYWLIHVTVPGTILLILYLSLYFGLFGLIIKGNRLWTIDYGLLFIPSTWVLLEFLRAHLLTGFPWALLGYSQYLNLPIIQIADITGTWGVSFLVMMTNVAIYLVFSRQHFSFSEIKKYSIPILSIIISLSYGYYKLHHRPSSTDQRPIKISVIQGNIPQELKWNTQSKDYIMDKYLEITRWAAKESSDLIIWPEAALPVILEEEPVYFEKTKELVKEIKVPLLLGAVTFRNNFYYNSALLISKEDSKILKIYDKLHLVPFGEYIPLKNIFPFLKTVVPIGDITPGTEYKVFKLPITFSVLICFEDLFPQISREFVKKGADFLINITNDAWYKKTPAAYQHLQASVFRAVENRIFLARAANTGVSGFINPDGKIISLVKDNLGRKIFVDGYKTEEIVITKRNPTFYTLYGDKFILILLIFILYVIFLRSLESPLI
jgi:apolipoprotein N-acyltransferase